MEGTTPASQISLGWFGIWRAAFLHPSRRSLRVIARDTRATIGWGAAWMGVASLLAWFGGPQRPLWTGIVADQFGLDSVVPFLLIGAPLAIVFGVISLMITAGISHGSARLFGGRGAYHQLVFCWGVIPPPFALVAALVQKLPFLLLGSLARPFSSAWIALQLATLFIFAAILLYLTYVQVVAYSVVEQIGVGKGLGILMLQALILRLVFGCLSAGISQFLARRMFFL